MGITNPHALQGKMGKTDIPKETKVTKILHNRQKYGMHKIFVLDCLKKKAAVLLMVKRNCCCFTPILLYTLLHETMGKLSKQLY